MTIRRKVIPLQGPGGFVSTAKHRLASSTPQTPADTSAALNAMFDHAL